MMAALRRTGCNSLACTSIFDRPTICILNIYSSSLLLCSLVLRTAVVAGWQCRVARSTSRRSIRRRTAFSRTRSTTTAWNGDASRAWRSKHATRVRTTYVATCRCRPRRRTPSSCAVACRSCRSAGSTRTPCVPASRPATRWRRSRRCSSSTGRRSSTSTPTSANARLASASDAVPKPAQPVRLVEPSRRQLEKIGPYVVYN